MPQKNWRAIKLQHDSKAIGLRDSRDFRGQYILFRRKVEDLNEGDEQCRLLNLLPHTWVTRVTKEGSGKDQEQAHRQDDAQQGAY